MPLQSEKDCNYYVIHWWISASFVLTWSFVLSSDYHLLSIHLICFSKTCNFISCFAELIQNLVQRKEVIEAVRFIFAFKLIDKFSPVSLLTKYVEDLKNSTLIVCKRKGKKPIEERVEEKV